MLSACYPVPMEILLDMPARFRLAELLEESGLSQRELAARSRVSPTTINRMANNLTGQVSLKTLDALELRREGAEIHVTAQARSFLHHQVRNMVGTLKLVGLGRWQPRDVARALAARDRRAGGPTAPAEGLALVAVEYDRALAFVESLS